MGLKGLLFWGGHGTRLRPCTLVTNKHLLPVDLAPLGYYSLCTLLRADVRDIYVLARPEDINNWQQLVDERMLGISITYIPTSSRGTGYDLQACSEHLKDASVFAVMGDCIHLGLQRDTLREMVVSDGASLLVKSTNEPSGGVVELSGSRVTRIDEEPENPSSNIIDTGVFYLTNPMPRLKEIYCEDNPDLHFTTLLQQYAKSNSLFATHLPEDVFWSNAGTAEILLDAAIEARQRRQNPGGLLLPVVVAYENGWTPIEAVAKEAERHSHSGYSKALQCYIEAVSPKKSLG